MNRTRQSSESPDVRRTIADRLRAAGEPLRGAPGPLPNRRRPATARTFGPSKPNATLAFYRNALGLEVRNDVASDGFRWVTLGSASQPDLEIVLSEPHAGRSQVDGDAPQELLTKGVLPMTVFRTDDVDAAFEKVRVFGAEVLRSPSTSRGPARLRVPGPLGQHGAHLAGAQT